MHIDLEGAGAGLLSKTYKAITSNMALVLYVGSRLCV